MKRIITLLITIGAFASLSAQTPNEEARRIILGGSNKTSGGGTQNPKDIILGGGDTRPVYDESGNRYPGNYPSGSREAQVDGVNREYDAKVYSIQNNRTLSYSEKERIIRQLNSERAQRIRQINNQYNSRQNRRYDDDDDRYASKNKQYKKDNGKHLGWEKGKGNQNKNKGKRYDD